MVRHAQFFPGRGVFNMVAASDRSCARETGREAARLNSSVAQLLRRTSISRGAEIPSFTRFPAISSTWISIFSPKNMIH